MIITVNYVANYRISFATNYVFTKCGLCYNLKTNKIIRQVLKGSTIGYVISGKFKSLMFLRKHLEKTPKKPDCPF